MTTEKSPRGLLMEGSAALGLVLDAGKTEALLAYLGEIAAWNERFNLTSITDAREMVVKHLLDSIALLSRFELAPGSSLVDIGAGAGLPGIPLKLVRPDLKLTLLESSAKKSSFLTHIIEHFGLENAIVANERAEDFGKNLNNRNIFSYAVSRAVADLAVLVEYALPLLRVGGRFFCYKAKGVRDEVEGAKQALNLLGGCIDEVAEVVVPFLNAERYLVAMTKVAPSGETYPRRAGVPAKRPIR
ncbi:MAG TPA: 16S rRNA (guanine(527)-N(7))-methyltransferase RsmG [Actinobacteria bacterium]|nr:16S rRNA (guanine(527)-N(7))-methyltransferase RsmG [Actinomycetota bacterium]